MVLEVGPSSSGRATLSTTTTDALGGYIAPPLVVWTLSLSSSIHRHSLLPLAFPNLSLLISPEHPSPIPGFYVEPHVPLTLRITTTERVLH